MRASSNNHYQNLKTVLPFTDIQSTANPRKISEDDTGYASNAHQDDRRNRSIGGLSSSSSSSNNQFNRIIDLVKSIPSPTDISTPHEPSDVALTVAQRIAQFSKPSPPAKQKSERTRITPLPDTTSESADSFALSNHVISVSSYRQPNSQPMAISTIEMPPSVFGTHLEYVHDDRFDSTTTVDDVKEDVIAIALQPQTETFALPADRRVDTSWRSMPVVVVLLSLLSGLLVSIILVMIII